MLHFVLAVPLAVAAAGTTPDPCPEEILRWSRAQMMQVEAVSGQVVIRSEPYPAGDGENENRAGPTMVARVVMLRQRDDVELGFAVRYEATCEWPDWPAETGTFFVTYDGEALMVAKQDTRSAFVVPRQEGGAEFLTDRRARHTEAVWSDFYRPGVFEVAFNKEVTSRLSHLGIEEFDGIPCHVVQYEAEAGGYKATGTWYIGSEDGIVRRYYEVSSRLDGTNGRAGDSRFTGVRINEAVGDTGTFAAVIPEGFEQVAYRPSRPHSLRPGTIAPAFEAKDGAGTVRTLEDFRGKVVVLDFWATWCLPCKRGMPGMQAMHEKWGDQGLAVIGISCKERGGDPAAYFADQGFTYTCLVQGDDIYRTYRAAALPTVVVIGRDGRIVHVDAGYSAAQEERLKAIVELALGVGGAGYGR